MPCNCGLKALHHEDNERFFEHCGSCLDKHHEVGACNPEEDIDRKINAQIDKALSDILSDVVERCISSSMKGCIEI